MVQNLCLFHSLNILKASVVYDLLVCISRLLGEIQVLEFSTLNFRMYKQLN